MAVTPELARANGGWRPLKLSESLVPISEADVAFPASVARCEWCMLGGVAASWRGASRRRQSLYLPSADARV